MARPSQAKLAAMLLVCASWLSGCATEGPPHPPRIQRPQRTQDLAVTQVGRALIVTFHLPNRAADGRRLTKPIEVQIFRQTGNSGKPAPALFVAVKPWVDLAPNKLPRFERSGVIHYEAILMPAEFQNSTGKTFDFMVQTLTRGFRRRPFQSDPSNIAVTRLVDVSVPVADLRAYSAQDAVALKWTAPSLTLMGKPVQGLAGYQLFRSGSGKPETFLAIGTSSNTSYSDKKFEFDHTYYYRVRTRFGSGKTVAESADSTLAVITPHDIFPPHAPQTLTAIYTGKAVELVWTPNLESDLAGYNIYRREDGQPPQKLNPSLQPTAIYRDFSAVAGHRYLYWATAVDQSKNESDPSAAVLVEAR
ncbi:MAG TPA: hypothetical protein VMX16_00140 [Terriglobia bacterium]|nr:hypothetical protein [Terriglobia bacterium]